MLAFARREQTSGVSFAAHEKLSIAQVLLSDLGVNRVEIAFHYFYHNQRAASKASIFDLFASK